jgi:nucleoside phosphorylase
MRNQQDQWQTADGGDIDWIVLTAIEEEFDAAVLQLEHAARFGQFPLPAKIGNVAGSRVLCVLSGKGSAVTAAVLAYLVGQTRASKVLLIGIAGGFSERKMRRGDIIVARTILAYEFGKLTNDNFIRRPNLDWQCDVGLLNYAMLVAKKRWFERIKIPRPDGSPPNAIAVHDGYVISGDKVVDDATHSYFREATRGIEEIHAVEMESVGAGAAVQFLQTMGVLRFLMIKGISDQPQSAGSEGSAQRAQWKKYAATAAAALACGLIEEMAPDSGSRFLAPDPMYRSTRHRRADSAFEVASLYRRFQMNWRPALSTQRDGAISGIDAVDWLLRSLIPAFERKPSLMKALEARAWNVQLPPRLPSEEEDRIRQLRNLGLVWHDGPWLFIPTRSTRVEPTPAGRLLIALHEDDDRSDRQKIVNDVVRELSDILLDSKAINLLEAIDRGSKISVDDRNVIRRLRNLHLIAHEDEFLPPTESLWVTGLGRYVIRCAKDLLTGLNFEDLLGIPARPFDKL